MLGTLRFFLALAVAFSHMGLTPDFHFGAMSVIVFYTIAGYVMSHSFRHNFLGSLSNVRGFYLDRLFRIYPLYIVSLVLIFLFVALTGYGKLYLDTKSMAVNVTLFMLNAYPTIMNPASWSLGTEVQFYVLLPFLVCFPWLKYCLLPLSYGIFVAASFGFIPPLEWGYKLLPGTLFFFITGLILHDAHATGERAARVSLSMIFTIAVLHLATLAFFPKAANQPYAFEELSGLILGGTLILVLAQSKPSNRKLDDLFGRLSYPLFLSHVCVLYGFDFLKSAGRFDPGLRGAVALQLIGAVCLAYPLMLIDDRFQKMRKRLQRRSVREPALGEAKEQPLAA
jgi:peptidoglycan/LPS O-acetylase OafA/YrhL